MQEELFDTTKSMTLEDAGGDLMLTKTDDPQIRG